jgi:type II secretory pathway component GspD/PulD (secretin)
MKLKNDNTEGRRMNCVQICASLTLLLMLAARSVGAQAQTAEPGVAESKAGSDSYQTFHLTSLMQQNDASEIVTDLRNMLPKAKLFYVSSQNALSIRGTQDDIQLAQKILSDIDKTKKIYHLTYAIAETDAGKNVGTQHFTLVVASGAKTAFRQGIRIPIVTGTVNEGTPTQNNQVQYVDVGLNIDAALDGDSDQLKLRSKVEQTSIAAEKSGIGAQDPVIHQTSLDGVSTLVQGKPLSLGSLDIPDSARHLEISVLLEPVR